MLFQLLVSVSYLNCLKVDFQRYVRALLECFSYYIRSFSLLNHVDQKRKLMHGLFLLRKRPSVSLITGPLRVGKYSIARNARRTLDKARFERPPGGARPYFHDLH